VKIGRLGLVDLGPPMLGCGKAIRAGRIGALIWNAVNRQACSNFREKFPLRAIKVTTSTRTRTGEVRLYVPLLTCS
jgi:hypothetical protein